jgi:hypothetical protein
MAGKFALSSAPVTQEPYSNRDCEDSRAHSSCHGKYTHVSQTLWRGLPVLIASSKRRSMALFSSADTVGSPSYFPKWSNPLPTCMMTPGNAMCIAVPMLHGRKVTLARAKRTIQEA